MALVDTALQPGFVRSVVLRRRLLGIPDVSERNFSSHLGALALLVRRRCTCIHQMNDSECIKCTKDSNAYVSVGWMWV